MTMNLNDEKVRDFSESTPFLPAGAGEYLSVWKGLTQREGHKGLRYWARFEIIQSNRDDISPGVYVKMFNPTVTGDLKLYEAQRLRSLIAGVNGARVNDPTFDANKALAKAFKDGEDCEPHIVRIRATVATKKDKKTGEEKEFTNHTFEQVDPSELE